MNAAFLLVTAAWLGADAPPAANPPPPPAYGTVVAGNGNCGNCGDCCEHHSWFRGRGHGCGCEDTCRESCFDKLKGHFHRGDCGCDTGCGHTAHHRECNTCNTGCNNECRGGCLDKIKGWFHRGDCGCDSGCNNGCNGYQGYGPDGAPIRAEPIPAPKPGEAPKKMPEAPKSVQILTPQAPASSSLVIEQ